ncbi:hypothetical protein EDB83DRAFT_2528460 [Lactarius deliciosus]|nr:hypothetical protein EDB83DRAFT_2528460 [Lactarius deliciosus]
MLTDNVLVEIFDFCRKDHDQYPSGPVWKWHILAHVSRRWRQIILASPRRLNLEILCTDGTPVRKNLGIWPDIPIVMQYGLQDWDTITPNDEDNVIAALEHPDRGPFPVLTRLSISSDGANVPVIPSDFLGGSARCLQEFRLSGVPFLALPTLLLSASDLVELRLCDIPKIGYISPEVMVAHLATLPKLRTLHIGFIRPNSLPDRILLPPTIRAVLPALGHFASVYEYMEDFVARIDAPQLRSIEIYYLDPVVFDFGAHQLSEFISRSENLKRTLSRHCQIMIDDIDDTVDCCIGATSDEVERRESKTGIYIYPLCDGTNSKILHLTRVLSQISPVLSDIIHFAINSETFEPSPSREDLYHLEWLRLLWPFSSVRTLFVAATYAGHVSGVLEDIAGFPVTEFLPALDLLCLEDQPISSVDQFVTFRRDSGRPITVINAKKEFEKRLKKAHAFHMTGDDFAYTSNSQRLCATEPSTPRHDSDAETPAISRSSHARCIQSARPSSRDQVKELVQSTQVTPLPG